MHKSKLLEQNYARLNLLSHLLMALSIFSAQDHAGIYARNFDIRQTVQKIQLSFQPQSS